MPGPENLLVDIERYEHDKKYFGVEVAEEWKRKGYYKYHREYMDDRINKKVNDDPRNKTSSKQW